MREAEIIRLLRERDEQGAEELLKHYGPLMRYIISPILHDTQDREECLSDVVMRIWNNIGRFDPERGSWRAWLTALTRNAALDRARHNKRAEPADGLSFETPSQEPTPEETVLRQERKEAVNRALERLPSQDRLLFYRKYYYLQSNAQIASELGMTERAVEGRLYRLRKQLRKSLGGEGYV